MIEWYYISMVALLTCGVAVRVAVQGWHNRFERRDDRLVENSVEPLLHTLFDDEELEHLPLEQTRHSARRAGQLAALVGSMLYGVDPRPLRLFVLRCGTDYYLLRRVRFSRGLRRAFWLRKLADLSITQEVQREAERYLDDRSESVRFAALLLLVTAHPESLLSRIAALPRALTVAERAELLFQLRRGLLPIAWQPLLNAPNANLQRLGLTIVEQFSIETAEGELHRLIATADEEVSCEALYVLASLRRPLRRRVVAVRLEALSEVERRSFLRHLSRLGYTPRQLGSLLSDEEQLRYERRMANYKRTLVCA